MDIGDPALRTAGLAALESAINRALKLDSAARRRIEALEGQVFHLRCTSPVLDCYVAPGRGGVRLMGHWEGDCETTISGAASDFAELAGAADPAAALINGDLALEGDSAPLLELQKIITSLDVDWEAPLVDTLGDVVGHQVAESLRGLTGWGKEASTNLVRQLSEFLQEEARLSPPRLEVEDFYKDLERLNLRLDRLAARLRKLGGGSANR